MKYLIAAVLLATLGGCVVVPAPGYYGYYGYHHHHDGYYDRH